MSDKKVYLTKTSLTWIFILSFIFSLLVMTSRHDFSYGIFFNTRIQRDNITTEKRVPINYNLIQNDPKLGLSKAELNHQFKLPPIEEEETFLKQKFDKQEWITKEDSAKFKNNLSIKKILKREAISFTEMIGLSEMSQLQYH